VADILARQDGVLSRHQARSAGMTEGQLRHRLAAGRWTVIHPSVYRSAEHPFTTATRVRAAGLWAGGNALLSGNTAAWWWGLPTTAPADVEIVIPRREHRRSRPGTRIVRRPVPNEDRAWVRAAPVTSLALSVVIASVQLGPDGPAIMDRALQTKLTMSALRASYYRNMGIGGSQAAGHLIRAAADKTTAASERMFLGLLKSAGIRGWRATTTGTSPTNGRSTLPSSRNGWRSKSTDGHGTAHRIDFSGTARSRTTSAGWAGPC
jgi:hypothetical protein